MNRLTGRLAEVDEDVGSLGWARTIVFHLDCGRKEALVGADLGKRLLVGKREKEEAAVRGIEGAEAVEAWLDLEVRTNLAVDEEAIGGELRDPRVIGITGGGVEELAVGGEVAVVEDEGYFVLTGGEVEGVFYLVSDEVHSEESGVGVESVEAHGVVVIPEGGCFLLVWVVADTALPRDEPIFGVAVIFGGDLCSVNVGDGADLGDVATAAVKGVIDGEEVGGGEIIEPLDLEGLSGASFDDGAQGGGAIAPHAGGRKVSVNLGVDLAHLDAKFVGSCVC